MVAFLRTRPLLVLVCALLLLALPIYWLYPVQPELGKPEIRITEVPPNDPVGGPNSAALIKGKASGVDPDKFLVLVYAHTLTTWYVQPEKGGERLRIINGTWSATIHTGTEYVALLVRADIEDIPATTRDPSNIRGVVAIDKVPGKQ